MLNVGALLSRYTNNKWKASQHRVHAQNAAIPTTTSVHSLFKMMNFALRMMAFANPATTEIVLCTGIPDEFCF